PGVRWHRAPLSLPRLGGSRETRSRARARRRARERQPRARLRPLSEEGDPRRRQRRRPRRARSRPRAGRHPGRPALGAGLHAVRRHARPRLAHPHDPPRPCRVPGRARAGPARGRVCEASGLASVAGRRRPTDDAGVQRRAGDLPHDHGAPADSQAAAPGDATAAASRPPREAARATVRELLAARMEPAAADALADKLSRGGWTHDYPITAEEAKVLGLPVSPAVPGEIYMVMILVTTPTR